MTNNTLPTKFLCITDPGHGWLVTTVDVVNAVDLSIFEFSQFSFDWEGMLFLEEDCDATLFLLAYEATTGVKPELDFKDVDTFDRHKPRLPGTGHTFEGWAAKCKKLDAIIAGRKVEAA